MSPHPNFNDTAFNMRYSLAIAALTAIAFAHEYEHSEPTPTPTECPTGMALDPNGICTGVGAPTDIPVCEEGYTLVEGECIITTPSPTPTPQCEKGKTYYNGACICPPGSQEDGKGSCTPFYLTSTPIPTSTPLVCPSNMYEYEGHCACATGTNRTHAKTQPCARCRIRQILLHHPSLLLPPPRLRRLPSVRSRLPALARPLPGPPLRVRHLARQSLHAHACFPVARQR
ncbi:hypothetical protein K458DRAFT_200836 [Lentithecium fluviatile CBS 122367]|uniref:Uncharacterized protein n=1 Tax=Lentithecium fluviatile CBS 122367 TaxID=1168545 RepID=A0A6G1J8S5_9PLEO|nr:hypothetical protein K458DRAFT_200836 [Lentithecium fluviatile CBS 122367]